RRRGDAAGDAADQGVAAAAARPGRGVAERRRAGPGGEGPGGSIMNALRLGLALALAFLLTAPAGCIGPDRSLPPPLEPVVPKERVPVALPPTRNESPLAVVADFTAETNRMLGAV